MIGHLALFATALVAATIAALAYPSPTGSDGCRARVDFNALAVRTVLAQPRTLAIRTVPSPRSSATATRGSC
jgi:hypothetical protein